MYQLTASKNGYRRTETGRKEISAGGYIKAVRLIVFTVISVLLITVMLAFTSQGGRPVSFSYIRVDKGDTLWSIAAQYADQGTDLRKIIYRIKEINRLEKANIYPGQLIKIPEDINPL